MESCFQGSEKSFSFFGVVPGRFRKIPEESGSPLRIPPRPKDQHGLRGGALALLGQAHTSPSKAHAVGKGGKCTFVWKGSRRTRIPPPPLGRALGFGGVVPHAP